VRLDKLTNGLISLVFSTVFMDGPVLSGSARRTGKSVCVGLREQRNRQPRRIGVRRSSHGATASESDHSLRWPWNRLRDRHRADPNGRPQGSRTAEPGHTCQVCARDDVTPGAGPHHGPPHQGSWPAPARPARRPAHGESLAARRGTRKPQTTRQRLTSRCTRRFRRPRRSWREGLEARRGPAAAQASRWEC
jgi:hypothetical protein